MRCLQKIFLELYLLPTLPWDEGKYLCIHVLSNETAAGDEIG